MDFLLIEDFTGFGGRVQRDAGSVISDTDRDFARYVSQGAALIPYDPAIHDPILANWRPARAADRRASLAVRLLAGVGFGGIGAITTERLDWYATVDGDDSADGLSTENAITVNEAIRRLRRYAVIETDAPIVVHVGSGDHYITEDLGATLMRDTIAFIGDGAGVAGDDGHEVVASGTAGAGTGGGVVVTSGLTIDEYQCLAIRMTSGAAAGWIRGVQQNSTTDIIPGVTFNVAPADGDTFEIVRPSARFVVSETINWDLDGLGTLDLGITHQLEKSGPLTASGFPLLFVNVGFDADPADTPSSTPYMRFSRSSLLFMGGEMGVGAADADRVVFQIDEFSTIVAGCDRVQAGIHFDLGVRLGFITDSQQWAGWGLSQPGGSAATYFFLVGGKLEGYVYIKAAGFNMSGVGMNIQGGFIGSDGSQSAFLVNAKGNLGGLSGTPLLIRNGTTGDPAVIVAGSSEILISACEIEATAAAPALGVGGVDNRFALRPASVSLENTVFTGSGGATDAVVVTGGGQVAFGAGEVTVTGFVTELHVRRGGFEGTTQATSTVAALTAGNTLPAAADGRDGFIRCQGNA